MKSITVTSHFTDGNSVGWLIDKWNFGTPSTGFALAHDILEHFPNDTGTIEEEFMAFGAMMFIRYLGGVWQNGRTWSSIVTDEIVMLLDGTDFDGNNVPVVSKCPYNLSIDSEYKDTVDEQLASLVREIEIFKNSDIKKHHIRNAIKWIRHGVAKAIRRYKINPQMVGYLFNEITEISEVMSKRLDPDVKATFRYDTDRAFVEVKIKEPGLKAYYFE